MHGTYRRCFGLVKYDIIQDKPVMGSLVENIHDIEPFF